MSDVARILKEARDQGRLTALDFAQGIFDDFIELHGDRNFRDDGAVIGLSLIHISEPTRH